MNNVVNNQAGAGSEQTAPKPDPNNNITDYIKNAYESDLNYFKENSGTKCGYRNIDKDQPFLPILYLIGGTTGSGKTTFCNQMAEHLARNENKYVLYFALEQTRFEHVNKIIARNMVIDKDGRGRFSSGDLQLNRAGDNMDYLETRRKVAEDLAGRLYIFDDVFNLDIENILQRITDFMKEHPGEKPVVFLDYLQILTPSITAEGRRLDGMEQIDHAAESIKQFQTKNQLAFVVISSFNRASYYEPAALESFKGSGGLEYTADLVAGIDFYFFHDQSFMNTLDDPRITLLVKKRLIKDKFAKEFKKRPNTPRDMVVHTLKNRRFTPYQEYRFFYFSAYDLFVDRGKVNKDYAKNYNLEELLNNTDNTNYIYNGKDWQNFKAAYYSSENDAQTSLNLQDETEQPADAPEIAAVDHRETVEEYKARRLAETQAKGLGKNKENLNKVIEKEIERKLKAGELVQDPAAMFDDPDEGDQDEQEEDDSEED
jgi:replicative DNA helicase